MIALLDHCVTPKNQVFILCVALNPRVNYWFLPYTHFASLYPSGSDGKTSACNSGNLGSILGLGRSPGGEHGNQLQYSFLENSMYRGNWQATVHGFTKSHTQLSTMNTFTIFSPFTQLSLVFTLHLSTYSFYHSPHYFVKQQDFFFFFFL